MESDFYLQARREWDERYGDLVLGKRNWQITSAGLMLLMACTPKTPPK
jgi:type IV secretory pathway TrbF-like protein